MSISWSTTEKRCLTKILLDVMNADGRIDDGEAVYMNHLRLVIGISDDDVTAARDMSVTYCITVLQRMADANKIAVGLMMAQMIEADGNADPKELFLFNAVHKMIGIPELN